MSICMYPNCDKPAIYDNMRVCRRHKNYISTYKTSFPMPSIYSDEPSLPTYCTDTGETFNTENCKNPELYEGEQLYTTYKNAYPNKLSDLRPKGPEKP